MKRIKEENSVKNDIDGRFKSWKKVCDICKRAFRDSFRLQDHKRVHSGEKPFPCKVCKKTFSQAANLYKHEGTHSNEKPFKCDICRKCYKQNSHLTKHMKWHKQLHQCQICKKRFGRKYNLNKHLQTHTGEKPYECDICGFKSSYRPPGNESMRELRI